MIKTLQAADRPGFDGRSGRSVSLLLSLLLIVTPSLLGPVWAQDNDEDIEVVRVKADAGEPDALFELAERHEQGDGVTQDLSLASALYEHAARRGHGEAQYRFALAQSLGLGLPASPDDALGWLVLAARSDTASSELAASLLDSFDDEVGQTGRDRAQAFADGFQPISGPLEVEGSDRSTPALAALTEAPESDAGEASIAATTPPVEPTAPVPETARATASGGLCGQREQVVADATSRLVGFVAEGDRVAATPGAGAGEEIDLIEVAPSICDMLHVLDDSSLIDPTIQLILRNQESDVPTAFHEGDFLVIEAGPGDIPRRIFIDYIVHDGTVIHLFPSVADPDNLMPSGTRRRIGEPGVGVHDWEIAPPFGNDLVILYASEEPLHEGARNEVETTEDYLPYLRDRLKQLAAGSEIGIDYHVVQTVAR